MMRGYWGYPGIVVLIAVIVVATTGCAANNQTNSSTPVTPVVTVATGPITPTAGAITTTTAAVTTSTTLPETTTTVAQTTTTTLAEGSHSDGTYLVGTDINSGLYHGTVPGDEGHWEISSDANGYEFVAGGDPTGPFYVKVTYGQYLKLSGVVIEKASSEEADPLVTSNITDGTYRVGYDIAAGWYNGTVNGRLGHWEISSNANGTTLVADDYPTSSFTLKVTDGQYLTLNGVTISQ
jgi:hypothetical protein